MTHIAIVLASNWDSRKDFDKLTKLEQMNFHVISVSDNACLTRPLDHIHTDFKVRTQKVCDTIASFKQNNPHTTITVILDHAYLANGYYTARYGCDWLSTKASTFFHAGASKLILPRDNGNELESMIVSSDISIRDISDNENPYFVASQHVINDIKNTSDKKRAMHAELGYTTKDRRFILVVPK